MKTDLKDGLYQVNYKSICAGFVVKDGHIVCAAPVLRRNIEFFQTRGVLVSSLPENNQQAMDSFIAKTLE